MAKKTTTAKKGKTDKTAKKDSGRESLAVELRELIPRLDSEGLAFLVEQARVHLYNMQVEELNKAAEAADASAGTAGAKRGQGTSFRIDGAESGSSYYLQYGNDNVMFSRDEMVHLVRIANAKGADLEIRERLYNWFDRERKDIFALVPIKDKFDDRLKALTALLRNSFKIRG